MLIRLTKDYPQLLANAESMHQRTDKVQDYYIAQDMHNYYVIFKGSSLPFYIGSDEEF